MHLIARHGHQPDTYRTRNVRAPNKTHSYRTLGALSVLSDVETVETLTLYVNGKRVTTTTALTHKPPRQRDTGMEYICESKDYNVAEFHDNFQENLPQLVKVVQGYCGEIATDVFDREQVMSLQAVAKQRRVISKFKVETYKKRLFSIPSTYFEKLCIVNKNGKVGKEKFMFEIISGFTLPQTVRFPKDRTITVGNNSVSTNNIPNIELIQTFDEVSLLGNFVYDGKMCTDLIHVPLYLSHLRLAVITGIKGYSPGQWKHFNKELETSSAHVEYDQEFGNPEIAEYDPHAIHSDATYTYVEPRIYSNIVNIMQRPVSRSLPLDEVKQTTTYAGHQQHVSQAQAHGDVNDVYEEIQPFSSVITPKHTSFTQELRSKQQAGLRSVNSKTHNTRSNKAAPIIQPKPKQSSTAMKLSEAPALPQRHPSGQTPKPQENVSPKYSNVVPRTQVKPTVHDKRSSTQSPQYVSTKSEPSVKQTIESTFANVSNSDDVSKLTIDEVIVYLQKLGLGQYEHTFREQMIDGVLLLELDRDMLRDDFGMKGIEAVRLTRFAKDGHVPT